MPSLRRLLIATAALSAVHAAAVSLFRSQRSRSAGNRRHLLVTQGGTHLRVSAAEMDDAAISVLMGGALVDFRNAQPSARPIRVDVLVVMGGVQIVVPSTWNVQIEADVTMGGIRDMRSGVVDAQRPVDIEITGRVLMGGLEIRGESHHGGPARLAARHL